MQPDDDATTIRHILDGDTDAYRVLVDRYGNRLYGFCRGRLGDEHDAEDAVQDVFIRAYRSLKTFDPARSFASWLFAIAANRVKSRYARRESAGKLVSSLKAEAAASTDSVQAGHDPASGVLDALEAERLRSAVATLPSGMRLPVELFYFAGLSIAEAAPAAGISQEAFKTRLFRARRQLRDVLEEKRKPGMDTGGRQ